MKLSLPLIRCIEPIRLLYLTTSVLFLSGVFSTSAAADESTSRYILVDLGVSEGFTESGVRGMNDLGQVVGPLFNQGSSIRSATFWPVSGNLHRLADGTSDLANAYGINNSGQIAGLADHQAVYWASSTSARFVLPVAAGGPTSEALKINASGQIVGSVFSDDSTFYRSVVWNNSTTAPVFLAGLPGGLTNTGLTASNCLNDAGEIVGDAFDPDFTTDRAVYWASANSPAVDLGALGGETTQSAGSALNNHGQIVGPSYAPDFSVVRGTYWASSTSTPAALPEFSPEFSNSNPNGINDQGQIVGLAFNADDSQEHPVLWPSSTSTPIDLNTVIPADSGWVLTEAALINNSGVISGRGTVAGHTHAFLLVPKPALYSVRDLGVLSADATESVARGINDLGQITGREFNADHSVQNALLWPATGNAVQLMQDAPGSAYAINNNGQIIGALGEAGPTPDHAVYWMNSSSAPVTLVAPAEYPLSNGLHINASAQMVGNEFNEEGSAGRALFWNTPSSAAVTLMNPAGGYTGTALGARRCLNDAGQIVGAAYINDVVVAHAVFWAGSASAPVDLGAPGGDLPYSEADDINNSGQIAGYAYNDTFSNIRGVFWANSSSTMTLLAPLTQQISNAQPSGINDGGQIVGEAFDPDFTVDRAVLWPNASSSAIDLNTVIPPGLGIVLERAIAINTPGAIVGDAAIGGHTHGFVLQPLAPQLLQVASRKTHGSAGTFDIPMPLFGRPGVESRLFLPTGSHKIVFSFTLPVTTGTATTSSGSVSDVQFSGNDMIVNLTNVSDAHVVTVATNNVTGATGSLPSASANITFLAADVNGDQAVNSADAQQTRNVSGSVANPTNFRADVNGDGVINSADATMVRARSGNGTTSALVSHSSASTRGATVAQGSSRVLRVPGSDLDQARARAGMLPLRDRAGRTRQGNDRD